MRSYAMPDAADTPPRVSPRRLMAAVGILVVILMAVGAISFVRYAGRNAPKPNLVAVAPFDIFVAGLAAWRVELAQDLTAALDAAPLAAVPQARVRAVWRSAPRPEIAAVELARRTSAGTAIYGRVDSAGADSVVARLVVADAASSRVMFGVVLRRPVAERDGLVRGLAERVRQHHPMTSLDARRDSI